MSRRNVRFAFAAILLLCLSVAGVAGGREMTDETDTPASDASPTKVAGATSTPLPFEPTEELIYEGEFSKFLLRGIQIAEFRFTAGRPRADQSTGAASASAAAATTAPLLLTGDIVSRGFFRKLFGINFHYRVESLVEPRGFKILRTTTLDEQGKRVRQSEALFDRERGQISWTERDPNDPNRPARVVNSPLGDASFDIISAIYYLRTQPLAPGRRLELSVSDSGRVYRIPVTVAAEKKRMKSVVGRVSTLRLDVGMFGQGRLIENEGSMTIWMTDDARRLPIRARVSAEPGTVDITLKRVVRDTRR